MKTFKTPLAALALTASLALSACGSSSDTTSTAASASSGTTTTATATATAAAAATPQSAGAPAGMPAMEEITGTAAEKASAAALAKYEGTVEHVTAGMNGAYVVHVITENGEEHVEVSTTYEVTGTVQLPGGGAPPAGAAPPASATSADATS